MLPIALMGVFCGCFAAGLLECPCTDRISKVYESTFRTQHSGRCATPAKTAAECFAAAAQVRPELHRGGVSAAAFALIARLLCPQVGGLPLNASNHTGSSAGMQSALQLHGARRVCSAAVSSRRVPCGCAELPAGCTATYSGGSAVVFYNTKTDSTMPCGGAGPVRLAGTALSTVGVSMALELDVGKDLATITLSGPAGAWSGPAQCRCCHTAELLLSCAV